MVFQRVFFGIGLTEYAFKPLKHARSDAASVSNEFENLGYKTMTAFDIKKKEGILERLGELQNYIGETTEIIMVYFAGHAVTTSKGVLLLLGSAERFDDETEGAGIHVAVLLDHLLCLKSAKDAVVVLFLDCCRSPINQVDRDTCSQPSSKPRVHLQRQAATIWACASQGKANDGEETESNSPFSKSLIRHLQDGVDKSLPDLNTMLSKDVSSHSANRNFGILPADTYLSLPGSFPTRRDLFSKHIATTSLHNPDVELDRTRQGSRSSSSSLLWPSDGSSHAVEESRSLQICNTCTVCCLRGRWSNRCLTVVFVFAVCLGIICDSIIMRFFSLRPFLHAADCILGNWSLARPCSATCGGGTTMFERPVIHAATLGGSCPAADDASRVVTGYCNMHSCPAGCCSVCDLRCDGRECITLIDFLKDPDGGFACAMGTTWDVDWRSAIMGRAVQWKFELTGPPFRQIQRSVHLEDMDTKWSAGYTSAGNVPDDEAMRQWYRIVEQCLKDYARRFSLIRSEILQTNS